MLSSLFYLFLFVLPFTGVSPLERIGNIPVGAIMVIIVLAIAGLFTYTNGIKETFRLLLKTPLIKILLLFWAVNIISLVFALTGGLITQIDHENILEIGYLSFAILVFVLVTNLTDSAARLRWSGKIMILAAAASAITGIVLLLGAMLQLDWGAALGWTVPRLRGTVAEPQVFGNYIISVLPLMFALLIFQNSFFPVKANILIAFSGLSALIMTFSVGAWAGFAGGMGLILIYWLINREQAGWISLGRVLTVIFIVVLFFGVIDRYIYPGYREGFKSITYKVTGKIPDLTGIQGKNPNQVIEDANFSPDSPDVKYYESIHSKAERVWFRHAAKGMFKEKPLTGVGIGNYGRLYNDFRPAGVKEISFSAKAHNQFLEVLAETGLIGFGLFIVFMGGTIIKGLQGIFRTNLPEERILLTGLLSGFLAVIIQGYSYGFIVHIYFWVLAGLITGAYRLILRRSTNCQSGC